MAVLDALEAAALAAAPVTLAARRGWYGLCAATGYYLASQNGQTPGHAEAFAIGRVQVIATLSKAAAFEWAHIDWPAIGAGLSRARDHWRAHARAAWAGIVRDVRLARDSVLRRRRRLHPEVRDIHDGLVRANALIQTDPHLAARVTADHIIDVQARIGELAQRSDLKADDLRLLEDLRTTMRTYKAGVVGEADMAAPKAVQPLFGPVAAALNPITRYAVLAAVLASGGVVAQQWRVEHVKDELTKARGDLKARTQERDALVVSYQFEHEQVLRANVSATKTAATLEAERKAAAAVAARERRRQREIRDVLSGSGEPPEWRLLDAGPQKPADDIAPAGGGDPFGMPRRSGQTGAD